MYTLDDHLMALASAAATQALALGISIATAESCTTGLVAHLLGQTPGISAVFPGGIVAYGNETKRDMLGVDQHLLDRFGAVSEPVAIAMARGAREALGALVGVATTGIAGPGGGTAVKPVGLTFVAVSSPTGDSCARFCFLGNRAENMASAAEAALSLLLAALSTNRT